VSAVIEHVALVGTPGAGRGFDAAIGAVMTELGFVGADGDDRAARPPWPRESAAQTVVDVSYLTPARGAWACLGTSPAMGRAIAARVAARLQRPLQTFTATARYDDRSLQCTVEDHAVRPDGKWTVGTFAQQLDDQIGGDWRELCDHKSHFVITALVEAVLDAWGIAGCERRDTAWRPPASLGDRRLDDIALRVRLAVRAQLATMDGRPCVRVTTADGATTTSFLTADELARLEGAVGGLITRS
jgi:hypothetical protein